MSHEIRTPLNGIIGFSKLLKDEDLPKEEIRDFAEIIQQSGNRLIEIVNNVLDISQIETGQMEVRTDSFSINSIIADLYSFFSPSAIEKGIKLNYNTFLDDDNCMIDGDENKLNQILINLINNAIKFTSSGTIDFGYEIKGNEILFIIKDTGIGISNEFKEIIFDRFIQAETSISRGYEGAGLGLAICKGLVELLGGRIWLQSEKNIGTTLFFTLPYNPSSIVDDILPINEDIIFEISKNRIKILIAEDDFTSFKLLKNILKEEKFIILHARNGLQALDLVRNNPDIELILMDIKMPVMDGIEATIEIKKIKPELPIIAQTAYAFIDEKIKILSIGCNDYISKPVTKDLLLNLIDKYLK